MSSLDDVIAEALSHPDEPLLIHDHNKQPVAVVCAFDRFMALANSQVRAVPVKQRETRKQRKDRQHERRRREAAQRRARRYEVVYR